MDAPWSKPAAELLRELETTEHGLSNDEARSRASKYGPNTIVDVEHASALRTFFRQLSNPLAWLLIFAASASSIAGEWTDASVVVAILLLGAALGFVQERRAATAIAALRQSLALESDVMRDGKLVRVVTTELVPGDVVHLAAGMLVPADGIVLTARDFFVSEAVLTGESHPVEKMAGVCPADAPVRSRTCCVHAGSSVRSGSAAVTIARIGRATEYGRLAQRLTVRPPETDFDRGLRRFGALLTRLMFVLVMFTTAANILGHKPPIESLLFAIAIAVGLAPEMLPAIVAINLARGAKDMAERGVVVRRLSAIENFGAMDVLCTDKTGTLTEGVVTIGGASTARTLELAVINASMQTGLANPLDAAIVAYARENGISGGWEKVDEIPYDFSRKRLSVVARIPGEPTNMLVSKGALAHVLETCGALDDERRAAILARAEELAGQGIRVLGVASKPIEPRPTYTKADEVDLVFEGLIELRDRPKAGAAEAIADLRDLAIEVKIVTGDTRAVAVHVAREVGIATDAVLTGEEIAGLRDEALWHAAEKTTVFAEVDPNQKERILLALRKMGKVVGFFGDGVNDAPALHSADVGISADEATEVARDAADLVLLRRDLRVLHAGVIEGRTTFANTMKYLLITESANFGNMVSMALAAAVLPFLPLLAGQVLLNNFLSDVPATAIATDEVDREQLERPLQWDLRFLRRYMVVFGLVSSMFDLLTFAVLYFVVAASAPEFRTSWFVESLLTEVAVIAVMRTRRPFYRSRPSRWVMALSAIVAALALALPYTPIGALVELVPLPPGVLAAVVAITLGYVAAVEIAKRFFFAARRQEPASSGTLWGRKTAKTAPLPTSLETSMKPP